MNMDLRNYNRPFLFFGLSIVIPWVLWFFVGYLSYLPEQPHGLVILYSIIGLIGLISPAIVALALILKKPALREDLFKIAFNFKNVRTVHILCAVCLMPLSILTAQAVSLLFGHSAGQFMIRNGFSFTAGIYPAWFLLTIAPASEEIGWHTYGTNALYRKMNLFTASLVFAVFWGFWHFPLNFVKGYYQNVVAMEGLLYSVNFLLSLIPFVLIMNWLYYKTNRNVVVAIVFHITAGFSNEILNTHPDSKVIQTILLLVVAAVLLLRNKEMFFNKAESKAIESIGGAYPGHKSCPVSTLRDNV